MFLVQLALLFVDLCCVLLLFLYCNSVLFYTTVRLCTEKLISLISYLHNTEINKFDVILFRYFELDKILLRVGGKKAVTIVFSVHLLFSR